MLTLSFPSNPVEFALACSICMNQGSEKCSKCKCEIRSGFKAGFPLIKAKRSIQFTVPGVPGGKGRPRFTRGGHAYTPEKTAAFEEKVRLCWKTQSGETFPTGIPLKASVTAWFPIPKSTSREKAAAMEGAFHIRRPDADNVAKSILDAINGYAYPDDSAVSALHITKAYTNAAPRTEITIKEAEANDQRR